MMRVLTRTLMLALLLALCPNGLRAQQNQSTLETPAGRRVAELIRLINSGDRAAARVYAKENYAPGFFERAPMEAHLNFISQLHDQTRGVEFHSIQEATPTEVTARVKNKLTGGWEALLVRVEADPPHRITGLGLRRPKAPAEAQPAKKLTEAEMVRELDGFLQRLAEADVFSGAVLLAKNGQPLFKKAYGQASKDFNVPNRVDTKFNLGSMNKMFTAVAIAQLAAAGKLSLEDQLSKYLPDFPDKEAA